MMYESQMSKKHSISRKLLLLAGNSAADANFISQLVDSFASSRKRTTCVHTLCPSLTHDLVKALVEGLSVDITSPNAPAPNCRV